MYPIGLQRPPNFPTLDSLPELRTSFLRQKSFNHFLNLSGYLTYLNQCNFRAKLYLQLKSIKLLLYSKTAPAPI